MARKTPPIAELLERLAAGPTRTATILGAGKPLTVELRFYVNKIFEHERPHLKQIARTVAALRE